MIIFQIMAFCLIATIIIECFFAYVLKIRDKKDFFIIILVNILTNPLVTSISMYINLFYGLKAKHLSMIFLEISALIIEAIIYKKSLNYKKINPYLLSLILNGLSYLFGILLNQFIWR